MRRVFQGAAVLVGFVCASTSGAQEEIRLGTIESRSQAGEPVSARIPIRRFPEQALERLEVGLAPARIFDRAGIERAPELSRLDFELVAESGDSPYIAVTSEEPIDEPLLDFLVQVSWPEGDLVREYTLLLEPPSAAEEQMPRQGRAGADGGEPFREVTREGEGERRDTAYGPVEPGDTLWRIAAEHRPDGSVTVAQTMLAILRLNPQAFASDNVNELLADAELELPSRAEIERLSAAEAQATYEEHLERWVPPAERSSEAASEEAPTRDPAGRDDPPQQAPDPASAEQARLRILALGDEAAGEEVLSLLDADLENSAANVHRLQGALAALREERESLRAEREDLRERVADLSERVAALERLVDLDMQGVLPPPEAEPTPAVPLPQVNEPLDPVVDGAGSEPEPEPEEPGEAQRDDAGEEGWLTGDASATEVWVEGAAQRQVLIGLGVTLLALAGGAGWLLYRRRRRLAREDRPQAQSQRDDSLALDLGEQRPRRDALQVADEYLADNDLRRAREVLERGLHREPERPDLRRRLLEVLARLDDREEFLAQAQELHDRTPDEADPDWRAVAAIGGRYAPESPLFAG
ncbi:MAG: FimV family protein, partial [Halorhodospira sp.]